MTREATSPELVLLRTAGQFSRLWLGIYKPNVIYTARLDDVPASTDRVQEITFVSGSGTLSDVMKEMLLWVGSTAGARDLGVCRLRKAPIAGTFYLGGTSEVDWQADCYLTVVDMTQLAERVPLMVGGTLKMDYETAYADQHVDFDPVPNLGAHAVAWLTGASVDVEFDASASWVFDGSITDYAWSAPGSSASADMDTANPTITYDTAGNYLVTCTVTADNGKSYTGMRYVMVFDAEHLPYRVELIDAPSADYESGGYSFGVRMYADANTTDIPEGALAILFSEDWYGSTKQAIGALVSRESVKCVGYIDSESIEWNPEGNQAEFVVRGAQEWLSHIEINPFTLSMAQSTPDAWETMPALTVDRAVWHLLHWRSNVTALMDIYLTDDARYAPKLETSDGSVWDQLADLAWKKIFARGGVDRFGRLHVFIDPQCVPEADRTIPTVMTLSKRDWQDKISITRSTRKKMSMLSTSGWITDLSGNTNVVYGLSMGHIRTRHGRSEIKDQLLAESQSQLNELTGLYLAWQNVEYQFELIMPQNNGLLDLFPPFYLDVDIASGDTLRGISYAGNILPRSLTLAFDPESMAFSAEIQAENEVFAELAVDGDVPPSTGVEDWDDSSFPDFEMPDLANITDFLPLPPSVENPNHPKVVVINTSQGVFYTTNFDQDAPLWQAMNNGLDADLFSASEKVLQVTPNGAIWLLLRGVFDTLYRASSVGGTWVKIATHDVLEGLSIHGLGINPTVAEQIAIVSGGGDGLMGPSYLYTGNAGGLTKGSSSLSIRPYIYSHIVYQKNNWYLFFSGGGGFGTPGAAKLSMSGSLIAPADIMSAVGQDAAARFGIPLPASLFEWDAAAPGGFNTIVPSTLVPTRSTALSPAENVQGVAFSPSGNYAMGASRSPYTPYLSTDGGASWSSVAGVLSTGADIWENCKDDNRWIFGGGTTLRLTIDRGASYVEKSGNLGYIAPLVDIQGIRFIS